MNRPAGPAFPGGPLSARPLPGRFLPGRPLLGLALLGAALLLAAAVVPPLAIVAVWPLLFVLPGWWLVARVAPRLSPAGRAGLAVVTSVYLSAHLVNLLSTLLGSFDSISILLAAAILLGATLVLAGARLPFLAPPPVVDLGAGRAALGRDRLPWALALLGTAAVGFVLGTSAWHQAPGGWVSGGWNWSDFLVHVAIGKSLMAGNFPPQVPYFAGAPLDYHWFADFHGAIVALVSGVDLIGVYVASSALMAGVLALLVWELALRLTGDRRAAAIATVLVLFGGGMGYIRLAMDLAGGKGSLPQLVSANSYDNTWTDGWPWFRIASVFGTGLLPHRATTFGLPGLVGIVLLAEASLGRRPAGVLLAGVLAALLAPFHFYAFPASYLVVLLLVLARREWRRPHWRRDAVLFLAPVVLALPFVVGPILQQQGSGAFRFVLGWSEARFSQGPLGVVFFYATNLGVPFLLALVAVASRQTPQRVFLALWLVALFLIPNLVVLSAVEFDMNKYFQIMWIAVAILAGWLIRRWPLPALEAVLAASLASPLLVGAWFVTSTPVALSDGQQRAAVWIGQHVPDRAVFVTDAFINSPVDLAGRLRLTTFGPYVSNLGFDPAARERDVQVVYCGGDRAAAQVLLRDGAGYVLSPGGILDCGTGVSPTDFGASRLFRTIYDGDGISIWQLVAQPT